MTTATKALTTTTRAASSSTAAISTGIGLSQHTPTTPKANSARRPCPMVKP
jgi:hypothetical protein